MAEVCKQAGSRLTKAVLMHLLHAFREWESAWDSYQKDHSLPKPPNADEFADRVLALTAAETEGGTVGDLPRESSEESDG